MKKKKLISMLLALTVTATLLTGCASSSGKESNHSDNESSAGVSNDSKNELAGLSADELFAKVEGELLVPASDNTEYWGESYEEKVEVQGHMVACGGSTLSCQNYFITDDNVLYHYGDSRPLLILEKEPEEFVSVVSIDHLTQIDPGILIKNKDGSYTYVMKHTDEMYTFDIGNIDAVYEDSRGVDQVYFYFIQDGTIYQSILNREDGSLGEMTAVKNGFENKKLKGIYSEGHDFFVLDENGTLSLVDNDLSDSDTFQARENVEHYLGVCCGSTNACYFSKNGDTDHIYLARISLKSDGITQFITDEFSISLPSGCKVDDIQVLKSFIADKTVFLVANDRFYRCVDPTGEAEWEEIEELSALYKEGYLVDFCFADYERIREVDSDSDTLNINILCKNGILYETNFD